MEMFAALAHFFKGREAVGVLYKERMPDGIYGIQIPDAMVALTATAVSAHPSGRKLLVLTRLVERFRLPLKKTLQEGLRHSRRKSAARNIGTTSALSKL